MLLFCAQAGTTEGFADTETGHQRMPGHITSLFHLLHRQGEHGRTSQQIILPAPYVVTGYVLGIPVLFTSAGTQPMEHTGNCRSKRLGQQSILWQLCGGFQESHSFLPKRN